MCDYIEHDDAQAIVEGEFGIGPLGPDECELNYHETGMDIMTTQERSAITAAIRDALMLAPMDVAEAVVAGCCVRDSPGYPGGLWYAAASGRAVILLHQKFRNSHDIARRTELLHAFALHWLGAETSWHGVDAARYAAEMADELVATWMREYRLHGPVERLRDAAQHILDRVESAEAEECRRYMGDYIFPDRPPIIPPSP